jgi:hypothetical protein
MTWKQEKLLAQLDTVKELEDKVVISGGLAWHIMSPEHVEKKTIHDHSDIDLFAIPERSLEVFAKLKEMGFNRYWTKYNTPNFYRYGKTVQKDNKRVKVLIDLFIETVPFIKVGEFQIVEPKYLLKLYETTHSSKNCTAVVNAVLVKKGIDPVGKMELIGKKNIEYVKKDPLHIQQLELYQKNYKKLIIGAYYG